MENHHMNPCFQVLQSCATVSETANFVHINIDAIDKFTDLIKSEQSFANDGVAWDATGWHYSDNGPLTVQYVFVMDALNFCFWPSEGLEYDTLALGLKSVLEKDTTAFDAEKLSLIDAVSYVPLFSIYTTQMPLICNICVAPGNI